MGNLTISLEAEDEQRLRNIASQRYKSKKGSLSKVIAESLRLLSKQSARERAMQRQFKWMEKGFAMGKILVRKREDIYDRAQ